MAEKKPNPMTAHLLNLVQGRHENELTKLSILTSIASTLAVTNDRLERIEALLEEQNERARGRA